MLIGLGRLPDWLLPDWLLPDRLLPDRLLMVLPSEMVVPSEPALPVG